MDFTGGAVKSIKKAKLKMKKSEILDQGLCTGRTAHCVRTVPGSATACPAKPWRSGVPGRYHRRLADDVGDVSGEDARHCARDARAPILSFSQNSFLRFCGKSSQVAPTPPKKCAEYHKPGLYPLPQRSTLNQFRHPYSTPNQRESTRIKRNQPFPRKKYIKPRPR